MGRRIGQREAARLRDPYAKSSEPASESHARLMAKSSLSEEARRKPALTGNEEDAQASIRVVSPGFRSLMGAKPGVLA
ncbi:MAG: hypothetical protein NC541_11810 [bacterium]|nr:hypothetical protein [bacterium]